MKLKMRIMTTLLGLVFGCGIAASQTPRAEQTMNSKRQYIAEVAALTSMGHLDQLRTVLIGGLNSGITVSELKEVMGHPTPIVVFRVPCADCKHWLRYLTSVRQKASETTRGAKRHR